MAVCIQHLRPSDGALLTAASDVFDDPIVPARAEEFLADDRHHLVVAIDAGAVVGFVSAVHYVHPDKDAPELWINEVGVAETHRRRGLARRMLESLLDRARTLGCREAWVLTSSGNSAARALYASLPGARCDDTPVMYEFEL